MPEYQEDVTPTWDGADFGIVLVGEERVADERTVDLLLCTENTENLNELRQIYVITPQPELQIKQQH